MSGLKSIRKGKKVEYEVRDMIRAAGYTADRVPASGASQGFKGDLHIKLPNGKIIMVEVKARKAGFKRLYEALKYLGFATLQIGDVIVSTSPTGVLKRSVIPLPHFLRYDSIMPNLKRLKGPSAILVVKQDRHPPLYLRWLDEEVA